MATNWTLAQAKKVITEGTDLAAITDIGRRFPLTALAIAKIGDNEGATTIINALPEHITARKIESVLKDGIADSCANDDDDDDDAEDAEHDEKPAKKTGKAAAKKSKTKTEPEPEDEDDDEDEWDI